MTDNARKVFNMLGVEPGERFKIKSKKGTNNDSEYYINEHLEVIIVTGSGKESPMKLAMLTKLIRGNNIIVKIPKKKQVKYLTEDDVKKICNNSLGCVNCPFHYLTFEANATVITCFKEDLIDHIKASRNLPKFFLNSEVEIPEEAK